MRRVLSFFAWKAKSWRERASQRQDAYDNLREGLGAYAARQAATYDALRIACKIEWIGVPERVLEGERQSFQRGTTDSGTTDTVA